MGEQLTRVGNVIGPFPLDIYEHAIPVGLDDPKVHMIVETHPKSNSIDGVLICNNILDLIAKISAQSHHP